MKTHGLSFSPIHIIWRLMIRRCYNTHDRSYPRYGGKGISVCDRWRYSLVDFRADMGDPPKGKSLDRWPNPKGNYEPGNCRWATPREQAINRKTTRMISYRGKVQPLHHWIDELGINKRSVYNWLNKGTSAKDTFDHLLQLKQ